MTHRQLLFRALVGIGIMLVGFALYVTIIGEPITKFTNKNWVVLVGVGLFTLIYTLRFGGEQGAVCGLITFLIVGFINKVPGLWREHPYFVLLALIAVVMGAFKHWWLYTAILGFVTLGFFRSWLLAVILIALLIITHTIFYISRLHIPHLLSPLRGIGAQWKLLLSFVILFFLIIMVYSLFYYSLYLQDPQSTFQDVPTPNGNSGANATFGVFIYQSVLVFATVGPPYPPQNLIARILVAAELITQIAVMVIYLTLLLQFLNFRGNAK